MEENIYGIQAFYVVFMSFLCRLCVYTYMTEKSYKKNLYTPVEKGDQIFWVGKVYQIKIQKHFFVKLKYFVMCQCRHHHRHVCAKIDDIQMKIIADPKDGSLS